MRNKLESVCGIYEASLRICSYYKSDLRLFMVMITWHKLETLFLKMLWRCDFVGVRLL